MQTITPAIRCSAARRNSTGVWSRGETTAATTSCEPTSMRTSGAWTTASWIWLPFAAPSPWRFGLPRSGSRRGLAPRWKDLLDHLTPYPQGSDPRSKALTGGVLADDVWAAGHLGDVDGHRNPEDVWLTPVFPFEDWTLQTRDPRSDRIVRRLMQLAPRFRSVLEGETVNTAIRTPIAAVRAGFGGQLPAMSECRGGRSGSDYEPSGTKMERRNEANWRSK